MGRLSRRIVVFLPAFCAALLLAFPLPHAEEGGAPPYYSVTGPCNFSFPRDHGAHPGYKTEWWYYTGNLTADSGAEFGFQLTIFRVQMSPPGAETSWPHPTSNWRTQQLYFAHAAITDVSGGKHYQDEVMMRGALGLAGVALKNDLVSIFIRDWSIAIGPQRHDLTARAEDFSFSLTAQPLKKPVAHGDRGYSKKGTGAERASCYYSFTSLDVSGELDVQGRSYRVNGLGWMDHEYSTAPLQPGLTGWDWFSLQLSDNTEIMIFLLRDKTGVRTTLSSGTFVNADGSSIPLTHDSFSGAPTGSWVSPRTRARYPAGWRLTIPGQSLDLKIDPLLADQEMVTNVAYWEGAVSVTGRKGGAPIEGRGYVELTGYANDFDEPL